MLLFATHNIAGLVYWAHLARNLDLSLEVRELLVGRGETLRVIQTAFSNAADLGYKRQGRVERQSREGDETKLKTSSFLQAER